MCSWRILLGGVASASILGVGVAAPTLARPISHAPDLPVSSLTQVVPVSSLTRVVPVSSLTGVVPVSSLTRVVPGGSAASGVGCDLPGLPQAGPVVSALAGAFGAPCGSSDAPGGSWPDLTGTGSSAAADGAAGGTTNAASRAASMLPGLSAVTSTIPGLSAVTSVVPGPGTTRSVTDRLTGASAVTGALSSLGGAFGGAQLGSPQP